MKTKCTVFFLFFFCSVQAQILNAGFEEWDSVNILQIETISPNSWNTGAIGAAINIKRDSNRTEGNYALSLAGSYGATDGAIIAFAQQKFKIPIGAATISFSGKAECEGFSLDSLYDIYGYGLYPDTFNWNPKIEGYLTGDISKDTSSNFQEYSFPIPDSLWGKELYLIFFSVPSDWLRFCHFTVDDIQLHVSSIVFTKDIENQIVTIFPNPTSDFICLKNRPPETLHLEIFSIEGKQVWKGAKTNEIDVSDLKSGCYFLIGKDELGEQLFNSSFMKN